MELNWSNILTQMPGLIFGIGLHEWAHAYVAYRAGDPTPQEEGRLSLNPLDHLDPLGTICILFAPIGWGKPVHFQPSNFSDPVWDSMRVAIAGPLVNIILCIGALFIIQIAPIWILLVPEDMRIPFISALQAAMLINMILAMLNLLPIPPLDGSKVAYAFLSPFNRIYFDAAAPYGIPILLVLVFSKALDTFFRAGVDVLKVLLDHGIMVSLISMAGMLFFWKLTIGPNRTPKAIEQPEPTLEEIIQKAVSSEAPKTPENDQFSAN